MTDPRVRRVQRIEVATMVGSAAAGAVLLPFGGTAGRMSLFLFGWAGGCLLHLFVQAAQHLLSGRRKDA
jgi:hypothetical protein